MEKIIVNESEIEVPKNIAKVYNYFKEKTDTLFLPESAIDLLVKVFAINFSKGISDYYSDDRITRSNWTHHTANTFFQTCQQFSLLCEFEIEKRHDGAIRDEKGNVYLCAEWEFDTNSIFKINGEIEKLYNTSKKHSTSEAMLFTYKVESDFNEFAEKVYDQWNNYLKEGENFKLYLLTALMKKDELQNVKYFNGIRIVVIGNNTLDIWGDYD